MVPRCRSLDSLRSLGMTEGVILRCLPGASGLGLGTRYISRTRYGGALSPNPVRRLDQEHVVRPIAEQAARVAPEVEVAERVVPGALLRPDEEHRGARPILPPQHRRAAQGAAREVRIVEAERCRWAGAVRIDGVLRRRRIAHEGAHVLAVLALHVRP